jgi:hypothetical protein
MLPLTSLHSNGLTPALSLLELATQIRRAVSRSIRGRALERDELIPGSALRLERNGPTFVQVRCVVADRKRITVQNIDALPGLPL